MKNIRLDGLQDQVARENFRAIKEAAASDVMEKAQWRFAEIVIDKAYAASDRSDPASTFFFRHGLSFTPKDVIISSIKSSDTAAVTALYDSFTNEFIKFKSTAACTIRCFIGHYKEG